MASDGLDRADGADTPPPSDLQQQTATGEPASNPLTIVNDSDEASIDTAFQRDVDAVIRRHSAYGLASGIIPVPIIDITVASTIQLRMIAQLADLYGIPFSEQVAKSTIAAIVASVVPFTGVGAASFSLVRAVPIVGPVLGLATLPALYGAVTYGLGKTFAWHFANGGTMGSLDPNTLQERFKGEFTKAQQQKPEAASEAPKAT